MADFIAGLGFDEKYFSKYHLIFISLQFRNKKSLIVRCSPEEISYKKNDLIGRKIPVEFPRVDCETECIDLCFRDTGEVLDHMAAQYVADHLVPHKVFL